MCSTPSPRERKHATDVVDAHDVVPHSLRPSLDVGVVSRLSPKFKPDTVTLHPALMPAFKLSTKLTTGAMVAQNSHVWQRPMPETTNASRFHARSSVLESMLETQRVAATAGTPQLTVVAERPRARPHDALHRHRKVLLRPVPGCQYAHHSRRRRPRHRCAASQPQSDRRCHVERPKAHPGYSSAVSG